MNRKTVVGRATLGALAAGLVPLAAAGAGAAPDSSPGLCRSMFGDRGPSGGPIVGEAPPGDPMVVSIGWDAGDWPEGRLGRIVTCVSVDGRAVPSLTNTTVSPPNSGSLTLNLALPDSSPGALVCEQSVLVGDKGADGRIRPTSPVCFKLRAPEPASPPPGRAGHSGGRTIEMSPSPAAPAAGTTPAIRPAPSPYAPAPVSPAPVPNPVSTPPARAAFEAATGPRPPAARPTSPMAGETARSGAALATPAARSAAAAATPARKATATAAAAAAVRSRRTAVGAPAGALPRTGLESHIPLAGAGGFLALGGAAVMLGAPRRRRA